MHEHFRPAQRMGAGNFGVENFLRRNRRQIADLGLRHGKHAVDPVNVEIFVPHVMRRRGIHRIQPAIAQHDIARRRDHKARLEIETGEVRVGLIGIASEVQRLILRHRAQRCIFRAVDCPRRLRGEVRNRNPPRIAREQIFGQHDQAHRRSPILFDEQRRGAHLGGDLADVRNHLGARVRCSLDRPRGQLQC